MAIQVCRYAWVFRLTHCDGTGSALDCNTCNSELKLGEDKSQNTLFASYSVELVVYVCALHSITNMHNYVVIFFFLWIKFFQT